MRGAEWYALLTLLLLFGVLGTVWFVTALVAAKAAKLEQAGIVAAMSAAVVCGIVYVAASIFATLTGLDALIEGSLSDPYSTPGTVGCLVIYPVLIVTEAWIVSLLGARLGVRLGAKGAHQRDRVPVSP